MKLEEQIPPVLLEGRTNIGIFAVQRDYGCSRDEALKQLEYWQSMGLLEKSPDYLNTWKIVRIENGKK